MAGATVTLTDALAKTISSTLPLTLADGSYSFDVTGLTAPFVIKASGNVDGTAVTLVSVQDTAPASGMITINITPITNAIAAALSSTGDPLDLDAKADAATIKSKITDVKTFVVNTLAPTLGAATGTTVTTANFDPVNTPFKADRSGLDKALDNIVIDVAPDGTVSMSNKTAVAKVDDAAETSAAPAATQTANNSSVVAFRAGDDFKAKAADPKAAKLEASADDSSVTDKAVDAFNACFKLSSSQRPTDAACTGLISTTYKNNGMTFAQELGGLLADPSMDNAAFNKPEVIRYLYSDPAKPADRMLVRISWTLTDGTVGAIYTVAKNFGSGTGWKLDGNQRNYFVFANAAVNRVEQTSLTASRLPSHYESGINFYVNSSKGKAATINWVKVTGNGLPAAGLILKPLAGCAYLAISSKTGNTATASGACASLYKMTGVALDGSTSADKLFAQSTDTASATGSTYTSFAFGKVDISKINPFDAYTFQIRDTGGSDTYIIERLRSRPMNLAELTNAGMSRKWNMPDAATKASLDPTNSGKFVGGAQFPVTWVRPNGAAPVFALNVQFRKDGLAASLIDVNPQVPLTASTFKVSAPSGATFPAATSTSLGYQFAQLIARNPNDLQVFTTFRYDNF